jgi:hypothetical protein
MVVLPSFKSDKRLVKKQLDVDSDKTIETERGSIFEMPRMSKNVKLRT